ncbi:hypothetical protein N867_00365 [Actinotalea fermentans ATCC 43279 = JCM 9966 = DSM 3133]|nr:hypothetical protein N867_00365 [Actinotalea fermentans ATCC 43279 = JCM 9966 = DSM 3133]
MILVVPAVLSLVGAFQWPAWASWSLMVLGLIGLVLGALVVWPKALVPRVAGATALERAKLQNDARTSLVSGTTIATALLAAVLAWNQLAGTRADSLEQQRATEQQQRATEQQQRATERQLWIAGQQLNAQAYNTAVTLLAGATVNERSAGVVAVQRMGEQGARAQLNGEDLSNYPLTSRAAIVMLTDHIASQAPLDGTWTPSTSTPSLRHDRADVQHALGAISAITSYRITQRARLMDVDLRGAEIAQGTFDSAKFDRSDLSFADARGGSGTFTSFCAATFVGASLRHAHLAGSDFRQAELSGADVTGADLHGAHFEGANLSGTIGLATANLEGATYDRTAAELAPGTPWAEYGMVLTEDPATCGEWFQQ